MRRLPGTPAGASPTDRSPPRRRGGRPYRTATEYDLVVEYTLNEPGAKLTVNVPHPHGAGFVGWAQGFGCASFTDLRGFKPWEPANPTRVPLGARLAEGRRHVSVVQVRRGGHRAYVDGHLVCHWDGDFASFASISFKGRQSRPALHTPSDITFHRAAVIEVNGEGKPLHPAIAAPTTAATAPATTRAVGE